MPEETVLILGPRRIPPVVCSLSNTPDAISIVTSVGFRHLESDEYTGAVRALRPDIVVGLADLVYGQPPGVKRRVKMVDRTHAFTMDATEELYGEDADIAEEGERCKSAYFAPVLPLENTQQSIYLEELEEEMRPYLSGLALYETASLSIVPESLGELPRLLLSAPSNPQDLLRQVSLGADLLTIPFLGVASDAGLAFIFSFPAPASSNTTPGPLPLAMDLRSAALATDTSPIMEGCQCYACQNHHKAYINHLLSAKEMLSWTLLQLHNYHTMDLFFSEIRASIQRNTFEQDIQTFERTYEAQFPETHGEGPRYVTTTITSLPYPIANTCTDSAATTPHPRAPANPSSIPARSAVSTIWLRNTPNRYLQCPRLIPGLMSSRNMALQKSLIRDSVDFWIYLRVRSHFKLCLGGCCV